MENKNIQFQNDQLMNSILENTYFKQFRDKNNTTSILEIFLLGDCSAHCKYCYLNKNRKLLYPEIDEITILKNVKLIMDWYKNNNFNCNITIFSAEWLYKKDFRDKIFNIIFNVLKTTLNRPSVIMIPTNMQFIKEPSNIEEIQNWIDKFKIELNIWICLSASIDGKYCDYDRTSNTDEFYNTLKDFLIKNKFLCHPMVSSYNAKNWIRNYRWWMDTFPNFIGNELMMLEVRDETWTKESIQDLLNFLNYVIDYQFKFFFHEDKKEFLKQVMGLITEKNKKYFASYNNIRLLHNNVFTEQDDITCTAGKNALVIRAGDLTIPICHRLAYEELILGRFLIENNKLVGIHADNVELLIMKAHIKRNCLPHCETCKYINCCTGFCMGNSYEVCKNPLIPTMEVCEMYQAKINFLICKYLQMGLFEYLPDIKDELSETSYDYIINLIQEVATEVGNQNG